MRALEDLGYQIVPLDISAVEQTGSRLTRSFRFRWSLGPGIGKLNEQLRRLAADSHPDLIWIDKGRYFWPETIREIRRFAPVVHYNPDDPFGTRRHGWRHVLASMAEYDIHLVPRDVNVEEYKRSGARRVMRFYWAYDRNVHRPVEVSDDQRQRFGGPIGFVGDREHEREQAMRFLAQHGQTVRIWGPNWERARPQQGLMIEGRSIFSDAYTTAICAFDINLGFLRKQNRDLSTTRSVEIPACGAFMLAERTSEHQELFREGEEAEFFSSNDELLEKTRYYLAHPAERKRIAAAGRARCLSSGYSNHDRLGHIMSELASVLNVHRLSLGVSR
jgi:hypothetical protein